MDQPLSVNSVRRGLRGVVRTSAIVFLFLVAAKFLNFLKKIVIGKLFGVSSVADAFFAASYLPYYVAIFFEGVLFLGFLPLYAQVRAEEGKEAADRLVSQSLIFFAFFTGGMVLLFWGLAPWLIQELVPGFSFAEQSLTRSLFLVLSLLVIFISLTSFFKALNSYADESLWASSSGMTDTAVMFFVIFLAWKFWGIHAAAWGAVLGGLAALLVQMCVFLRRPFAFSWSFSYRPSVFGGFLLFLIPMGLIWFFQQIPLVILNRFGSGMWEGTISALNIAHALTTVPIGLVSHMVLYTIFPSLARQSTASSQAEARQTFFQTLRGGFFVLIPAGFLLTALARPLAALFFDGSGIAEEGTRRISNALTCFGWSTFALYADLFMSQSLVAVRKTRAAILLCASRAALSYVLSYLMSPSWDYQGLALAFSLALAVNFYIFFPLLFRGTPFTGEWKTLYSYGAKLMVGASPAFVLGWLMNRWSVANWMSFSPGISILAILSGSLVILILYAAILHGLKLKEIYSVVAGFKQMAGGKFWPVPDPAN